MANEKHVVLVRLRNDNSGRNDLGLVSVRNIQPHSLFRRDMHSCFFLLLLATIFFARFLIYTDGAAAQHYYNCSSSSTYAPNSTYHSNLQTLLSWLSSNATTPAEDYNATVTGENTSTTVYGLFHCVIETDDAVRIHGCKDCVIYSVQWITKLCPVAKEAIIWNQSCFLRYSDRYFFSTVDESPRLSFMNQQNYAGRVGRFNTILWDTLNDVRNQTANGPVGSRRFGYKSMNITDNQTLYVMAWCLPYLSVDNCSWCLSDAIAEIPTYCCRGKAGGRVIFPSCAVRYELYPFHHQLPSGLIPTPIPLAPSAPPGKKQGFVRIIAVVVPIFVSLVLSYLGYSCFLRRRQRKNQEAILKESFGEEVTNLESLRFDLGEIESATNKFAKENMIGKGGFGEVYKGILANGQEIAVKRLLGSSQQGTIEFKNEVLVIAQLQHKNLVRLEGFCLDGQEKLLIYEYVPNKSLDYFLFDPQMQGQLTWLDRYKIIEGIARGILYLHEDFRLKIIHRDLKPSNVLLDSNKDPKISDFGMARIIAADQVEETCRIVGTYGYMSPEYAMHGQFSIKSDVFSFGVMVLEIISGKRKASYESDCVDDIRKYAWTKWRGQTPLELMDPNLEGSYSESEVIRCIHIGLLCVQEDPNDRPTMAKVVSYLNSPSVDLPLPRGPAFSMPRKLEDCMPGKKLNSLSDDNCESISEMTQSNFYPR